MDFGISGRRAIVCASSRGLGRACAQALAAAGCEVVINGRDEDPWRRPPPRCAGYRRQGDSGAGRRGDPGGPGGAVRACPEPDILVNNNAGPPLRDFRELTRQQIIDGVVANMAVAIELIQKSIDPMTGDASAASSTSPRPP